MRGKPSILLIVASNLDYDGINCLNHTLAGYAALGGAQAQGRLLTPAMDSLAGEGVVFSNYYCASGESSNARYALLTGRSPERCGKYAPGEQTNVWGAAPVLPGETSLPKALKAGGYRTAFFGKWSNFPEETLRRIEMCYHSFPPDTLREDPRAILGVRNAGAIAQAWLTGEGNGWDEAERLYAIGIDRVLPLSLGSVNLDWIVEGAVDSMLRHKGTNAPFFTCVSLPFPEGRYQESRFATAEPEATPSGMLDCAPGALPTRSEILQRVRMAGMPDSAAEGLWLDECVRALRRAAVEASGEENVITILTSDAQAAGGGSAHLGRIPLIIHWPGGIRRARIDGGLASEVGLASTVLRLAGCDCPADMRQDGADFAARVLSGEPSRGDEAAFIETAHSRALVSGDYKYIANRLPDESEETYKDCTKYGWQIARESAGVYGRLNEHFAGYFDTDQLYDVRHDPLERRNLWLDPRYAGAAEDMRARLAARLAALPHPFGEFTPGKAVETR